MAAGTDSAMVTLHDVVQVRLLLRMTPGSRTDGEKMMATLS